MRTRDRLRIAKFLYDRIADLDHYVLQQLNASAWYFEQNAEGKGYEWLYGAADSLEQIAKELRTHAPKVDY